MPRVLKFLLPVQVSLLFAATGFGQAAAPAPLSLNLATPAPAASSTSSPAPTSAPAATAVPPAATSTPKAPVVPPVPPPPSVPDGVNPFADEQNPPKPLDTINALCTPMTADMHVIQFDGNGMLRFFVEASDFEWEFDPLDDWILAPSEYGESFAFVYSKEPTARLSFSLYGAKELLPDMTPASIVQYLAAIRATNPKGFILTTPIPPGVTQLPMDHIANYAGQGVTYATTSPTLLLHHDWFADLNGEYQLVIKLTSPPALMSRLETQVRFILNRGVARKGLGIVPPPPPGEAPPADTSKRNDG